MTLVASAKKIGSSVLGFLVVAGCFYGYATTWALKNPGFDTDRWYHLALSRTWAEQGITHGVLRSLPQVENLHWDKYFPDKEFLFHVFTTVAYLLGGETGTRVLTLGLALALLAALYFFLQPRTGTVPAIVLVVPLMLMIPSFSPRLLLLRAYLAAMLFVVALVISLWKHRPWGGGLAAAAYALTYHAFVVPLTICVPALLLSRRFGPQWARTARYSVAGLGIGYLVNPYFPANILKGWQHALFALRPALPQGMEVGRELIPLGIAEYLLFFYPHLAVLGLCFWFVRTREDRRTREKCLFFLVVATAFWLLALKSPRASEYAIPLTVFAAAVCLEGTTFGTSGKARWGLLLPTAAALVLPLMYWAHLWRVPANRTYQDVTLDIRAGLERIPRGRPAKVLNCDWGLGAYILYFRPDLHFVDLLDARFLREEQPEHFRLLAALKSGRVADPRGAIADGFNAQYVLCHRPDLNAQLSADPSFKSLFRSARSPIEVFSVAQQSAAD